MIWQLVRRDPAWKTMQSLALALAALSAYPPFSNVGVFIFFGVLFGGIPHRRASRFEAALPIEARDLLLARALSLIAVSWIPALSAAAAIAAVRGPSALVAKPLAVAALATLTSAVAQAAWLKEIAGPKWIIFVLLPGLPAAGLLTAWQTVAVLLPLCTLAGLGLFAWTWVKAPKSFQLAGAGVKADEAEEAGTPASQVSFRWAPVLHSVYSWQYVFFVLFMGIWAATGLWVLLPFWFVIVWQAARAKSRWLWALPVGRHALLWTIIGPIVAAHVLGYLAGLLGAVPEPRVVVVTLAAMLGWVTLTTLFCVLFDWRGFARIPRRVHNGVFLATFVTWYVGFFAAWVFGPYSPRQASDALAHFARTAPLSLPALIAAAAAVLIALYWAVEKVFSEPDFADKPRVAQPDAF